MTEEAYFTLYTTLVWMIMTDTWKSLGAPLDLIDSTFLHFDARNDVLYRIG